MEPSDIYRWLLIGTAPGACDAFDAHIIASTLSLAIAETTTRGRSLVTGTGLDSQELRDLVAGTFPHATALVEELGANGTLSIAEDEACVRDLLRRHTTDGTQLQVRLSAIVARRAQEAHHLWQDLGLRHRRELSWLMARHFASLAALNVHDMKWKKFLYRTVCRDEGYAICTAPSCADCDDFEACFGEESGESLLASARRAAERR